MARIYGRQQNQWSHRRALLLPTGLEGAVNTTASSVRSNTSRGWRGDGGEEAGEWVRALCCWGGQDPPRSSSALLLGGSGPPPQQQRSAAGGVRPPPLAAGMALDVQGGVPQCAAALAPRCLSQRLESCGRARCLLQRLQGGTPPGTLRYTLEGGRGLRREAGHKWGLGLRGWP